MSKLNYPQDLQLLNLVADKDGRLLTLAETNLY